MIQAGFHRASLSDYTGCKTSPYPEGALFYGEKLVDAKARGAIVAQAGQILEPLKEVACDPGGG